MDDDRSVEVELVLHTEEGGFGSRIQEIPGLGLFFPSISPKTQLGKILGKRACLFGAVLLKFEGEKVPNKEALNEEIKEMGTTSYSVTLGKSVGSVFAWRWFVQTHGWLISSPFFTVYKFCLMEQISLTFVETD